MTVDFPQDQMEALAELSNRLGMSRSELIRNAVKEYLQRHIKESLDDLPGFGCWSSHSMDGLEYQNQIRREWDR